MLTGCRRLALAFALCAVGCGNNATNAVSATTTGGAVKPPSVDVHTEKLTKLETKDVKVGKGASAADGDQLVMRYTGKLPDGTVFDSNDKADGQPLSLVLGAGSVIKGWDQGLVGMKEGGERKLSIPAELGYGAKGASPAVPPNSDLYFDVKLQTLLRAADKNTVTYKEIKVGDGPAVAVGDSVTLTYTASMPGQPPFDSTDDRGGKPMTVVVGGTTLLPAISKVLVGMKKGGERQATVPTQLGPHGPTITPGSPTIWDLKLVSMRKK